jgi:hypothetical protein
MNSTTPIKAGKPDRQPPARRHGLWINRPGMAKQRGERRGTSGRPAAVIRRRRATRRRRRKRRSPLIRPWMRGNSSESTPPLPQPCPGFRTRPLSARGEPLPGSVLDQHPPGSSCRFTTPSLSWSPRTNAAPPPGRTKPHQLLPRARRRRPIANPRPPRSSRSGRSELPLPPAPLAHPARPLPGGSSHMARIFEPP